MPAASTAVGEHHDRPRALGYLQVSFQGDRPDRDLDQALCRLLLCGSIHPNHPFDCQRCLAISFTTTPNRKGPALSPLSQDRVRNAKELATWLSTRQRLATCYKIT